MLPASDIYKASLHGPHQRISYLHVYDIDGNARELRIPIISGSVTANLTNRVTRSAEFTLADRWFPRTPEDPLSPYFAVVKIFSGTGYATGEEVFPLFTGRVYVATRNADGSASFRADDLAADVIAYRFEAPEKAREGTVNAEIRRLVHQAVPQAVFGDNPDIDATTPNLVWDEDRGQALDDLAKALGCRWYTLGDGTFVVRPFDYSPVPPVQEFLEGPAGLMSTARLNVTRDGTANSVVVVSERMDGTDPVRTLQRTVDSNAPTQFGGPYGRVSQVIKVQTPLTPSEANTLARTQLRAATALITQWDVAVTPDMSMEPGDTATFSYRGETADQIIDTITYPLLSTSLMSIGGRAPTVISDTITG